MTPTVGSASTVRPPLHPLAHAPTPRRLAGLPCRGHLGGHVPEERSRHPGRRDAAVGGGERAAPECRLRGEPAHRRTLLPRQAARAAGLIAPGGTAPGGGDALADD